MSMEAFYEPDPLPNPSETARKLPKVPETDPDHIPKPVMPDGPGPKFSEYGEKPIDLKQKPKPEEIPVVPADYLENDQRYKELLNQAALEYLKTKDNVWFQKQGLTHVNEKGNLVGPGGKEEVPITLIGGGDSYKEVTENAKKSFGEKYKVDDLVYKAREAIRVYDDPERDPAYKKADDEILAQVNRRIHRIQEAKQDLTFDEATAHERVFHKTYGKQEWTKFAQQYPKKAEAYRGKNEFIDQALKEAEEKKKQEAQSISSAREKNFKEAQDYLKAHGYDEAYVNTLDESQAVELFYKSTVEEAKQEKNRKLTPEQNASLKAMRESAEKPKKAEAPANLPTAEKPEDKTEKKEEPKEENAEKKETVSGDAAVEKQARKTESAESKRGLMERFRDKLGLSSLIDSAKISFNGYIANWQDKKVLKREKGYEDARKNVAELEEDVAYLTEQAESFRKNPDVSEDNVLDVESDRRKAEELLNRAREAEIEARLDLDRARISREGFIIRRDEACHSYINRMKSELRPFEEDIAKLSAAREEVLHIMEANEEKLEEYEDELAEFEAENEQAKRFPSVHRANGDIIRKIKAEMGEYKDVIRACERGLAMIDKALVKNQKRALPFQNKIEDLKAIMKGKVPKKEEPEKASVQLPESEPDVENVPTDVENIPTNEEELDMHPITDFIEGFNAMSGDKMEIDAEVLRKSLEKEYRNRGMSSGEAWAAIQLYMLEHGEGGMLPEMPGIKKKKSLFSRLFGFESAKTGQAQLGQFLKQNPRGSKSK